MNRWLLDTDHVSLLLGGNQNIAEQLERCHPDVFVSIVTVQELLNGWVGRLNRNTDPKELVRLYGNLSVTVNFIQSVQVLKFDERAMTRYIALRQQNRILTRRRIEKDVRIAAIALSQNATVVTRNRKDFELISGLTIENWADV